MSKPALPKGTRDFLPKEVIRRKYLFGILEEVFSNHGFVPIETPSLELLNTLTGKYGEEGDRLLFKILNNGNFLEEADKDAYTNNEINKFALSIAKRGLRYDLTVPFARFVVMNRANIFLPFKRYQIQPVWRADRPQKGRYQEFYQCDCDVVGSSSLLVEADLINIFSEAFSKLGIAVTIRVNHRGILSGIAESARVADRFMEMTLAIDKLDKSGIEGVRADLLNRGFTAESVDFILSATQAKSLESINDLIYQSEVGRKSVQELKTVFDFISKSAPSQEIIFDPSLARGLSYYTGFIVEVVAKEIQMGSIGGGGRYDNLTGVFGMPDIPGVGISFGAERIYDIMEALHLFPASLGHPLKVLVIALDEKTQLFGFEITNALRNHKINADQYPDLVKMNKSMKYANDLSIPYVIIIGEEEQKTGLLTLKNMTTGEQEKRNLDDIIQKLK